jgi:hypothetical protein
MLSRRDGDQLSISCFYGNGIKRYAIPSNFSSRVWQILK